MEQRGRRTRGDAVCKSLWQQPGRFAISLVRLLIYLLQVFFSSLAAGGCLMRRSEGAMTMHVVAKPARELRGLQAGGVHWLTSCSRGRAIQTAYATTQSFHNALQHRSPQRAPLNVRHSLAYSSCVHFLLRPVQPLAVEMAEHGDRIVAVATFAVGPCAS